MKYVLVDAIKFAEVENAAFAFARQSGMLLPGDTYWARLDELRQVQGGAEYPLPTGLAYPGAYDTPAPPITPVWYAYVWTEGGSLQAAVQGPGWPMPEPAATAIAAGLDVERIARQSPAELAMEGELRYGAGNDTVRGAVTGFVMAGWLPDPTKHWDIGMPGAWKTPAQVPAGQGVNWPHREILRHSDAAPVLEYLRSLAAL